MSKMVNVSIEGLGNESENFEILTREELEQKIYNEIDIEEVYGKTYKQAEGYTFGGTARTYIDARDGSLHTYWMGQNNYNHPYNDFYEIILCRLTTNMEEPVDNEYLDEDEVEEYEEGQENDKWDNLEEYAEKKGIDLEERLDEIITSYAEQFELDVEDIEEQLNILYENELL